MTKKNKPKGRPDIAGDNFDAGYKMVSVHPLFRPLLGEAGVRRDEGCIYVKEGAAFVANNGSILCNPRQRFEPGQWARALAHCLLHLGMSHFQKKDHPVEWNIACDYIVEKFIADLGFGIPLYNGRLPSGVTDEVKLYNLLCGSNIINEYAGLGTAGPGANDMLFGYKDRYIGKPSPWEALFACGLANAVQGAVNVAAGNQIDLSDTRAVKNPAERTKEWFISNYPLLGAVGARFKIVYDANVCERMGIAVAAVSAALAEIYINPKRYMTQDEMKFVLAHEFLHAALGHDVRRQWRNAYIWNVACDFVINQWLMEMGVGERPDGTLYDAAYKGMNAEAVYDLIINDMRKFFKMATYAGIGQNDILPGIGGLPGGADPDDYYRRALASGLSYHREQNRGFIPQGLIEEIYALAHPPIPWDVELARWFDGHFTPAEHKRSYARQSRRQSSTPGIPRPNRVISQTSLDGRTFGVVLDTSGSMDRNVLAASLGAIASYSAARDVYAARVVFCDADAYDAGYMKPEEIAGSVKVKGRGGTILQPGIDLLLNAEDFPKNAPILIITDGKCDKLVLYGAEQAYLIPHGAALPFVPKGDVFRMR